MALSFKNKLNIAFGILKMMLDGQKLRFTYHYFTGIYFFSLPLPLSFPSSNGFFFFNFFLFFALLCVLMEEFCFIHLATKIIIVL